MCFLALVQSFSHYNNVAQKLVSIYIYCHSDIFSLCCYILLIIITPSDGNNDYLQVQEKGQKLISLIIVLVFSGCEPQQCL